MIERYNKTERKWEPSSLAELMGVRDAGGPSTGHSSDELFEYVHIPASTQYRAIFRTTNSGELP